MTVEVKQIDFERLNPHGWTTIVFPEVHDLNTHLDSWMDEANKWLRLRGFSRVIWGFAHGKKKDTERVSPVFYFKDELEGIQMMWRFKGEKL